MTAEEVLAAILDSDDENNESLLSSDEESSMYIDTDAENVPDPCVGNTPTLRVHSYKIAKL